MSKTRLFLGASLIALAIGSFTSAQAGFDRGKTVTSGLGNSATAGAYNNPYLRKSNEQREDNKQSQAQQAQQAQQGGYAFAPIPGYGFMPPYGGYSLNLPGMSGGVSTPVGGFGFPIIPGYPGGFNINLPGMAGGVNTPYGGFGISLPGMSGGVNTPYGGFGINLPGGISGGVHSPFGGFNLGPIGVSTPIAGFGLPMGPFPPISWGRQHSGHGFPGGFSLNLPGVSAHGNSPFGGFNIGPIGMHSPFGGFNLGPVGFHSPIGGFGFGQTQGGSPFHGFGLNLPGVSAHGKSPLGGFSLFTGWTPHGGFDLKAPGVSAHASSPIGGFGIHGVPSWAPVVGGFGLDPIFGFNLGREGSQANSAAQSPYAPYGYGSRSAQQARQEQPRQTVASRGVSCSVNEVSVQARSVSDCEKAGGTVIAANTQR